MPGFKDFVNLTALTESDLDDYLAKQVVMKFATAAARTAALTGFFREGIVTFLDDSNTLAVNTGATDVWSTIGPVHGTCTNWTPVVVQSATPTLTVTNAVYTRTGRWIQANFLVTITGAGTAANDVVISGFPTAAGGFEIVGVGGITDTSAVLRYPGHLHMPTTTTLKISQSGVARAPTGYYGSIEFVAALANTDTVWGSFAYMAAADA